MTIDTAKKQFRGMYKWKWYTVQACSTYEAQQEIQKITKAKKSWDIHGIHIDTPEAYNDLCIAQ